MTVLYLGSDPERFSAERKEKIIHFPLLEIVPRPLDSPPIAHLIEELPSFTHCIFTSKHTVFALRLHIQTLKNILAIGQSTAAALKKEGITPSWVAKEETQEGIIAHLRLIDWGDDAYVLLPRSSLARSGLENFFILRGIRHQVCDLYDTRPRSVAPPVLDAIEEIVFTSPSTVHAFRALFPTPPPHKRLTPIGPITAEALRTYMDRAKI